MKGKKTPLNFADQTEAPAPPPMAEDELTLAMPALPAAADSDVRLTTSPAAGLPPPRYEASRGAGVYWLAALASALWGGGMVGLLLAYQQRLGFFDFDLFALGVFGVLALAPLGLIWLAVHTVRQGATFIAEARRSQDYAEQMLQPAAFAAAEAGSVMESIRGQIERAADAAARARDELIELRDLLAEETEQLVQSAAVSTQTARVLVEGLGHERHELTALTGALDGQAQAISEAITRQARMVAEASDLAQTQIAEAEAALAARAADLTAAAGEAGTAARIAGEDLSRQAARLEAAGTTVAEQVQIVEDVLGQQRAALAATAVDLRADQEDLAVQIETQRAQLAEIVSQTGDSVISLNRAAADGSDALRQLTADAADQFREVAETAQAERDLLGATALQSLGAFSEAAAFERRALEEQTRRAIDALQTAAEDVHRNAETSGEAARLKVEQLSEAAFAAGQKADTVFDARLSEARELIERTAQLVDDAGERSAARLDTSVAGAREALAELERGLAAIEARSARLPHDAQVRADEVRAALEQANQSLLESARQASEETQAIDAAFQERVKRNYEMLSEAVRLMGVIGGGASARASGLAPRAPLPRAPAAPRPQPAAAAAAAAAPAPAPAAPGDALRQRLKLTTAAPEDADKAMFEPIEAHEPDAGRDAGLGGEDEWTWTDLLGAVDDGGAVDEASLAETLIGEIEAIGLDPASLLPRSRIDDVLTSLDAGNPAAGRESVRRLAPAAIRRLSRRVLSDKVLRSQSDRFIQSYQSLLREAGQPDAEVSRRDLLDAPAGRAFLLLDAAVGDLN